MLNGSRKSQIREEREADQENEKQQKEQKGPEPLEGGLSLWRLKLS